MTSFASIEVDAVTLYGTQFGPNNAVPKHYVDTAVEGATTRIDTILAGSTEAYDTLLELKTLMDDTKTDVGTALATKVGELSAAIESETSARSDAVTILQSDLATELDFRQTQFQEVRDAIDQEMLDREQGVQGVQDQHEAFVTSNNTRILEVQSTTAESLSTKFDKAGGYLTRSDGALEIDNDHYLYLGTNWRLRASQGDSKRRRLEFEHSDDQSTWQLAVPFIRGGI